LVTPLLALLVGLQAVVPDLTARVDHTRLTAGE
jgi:hypothetical protein